MAKNEVKIPIIIDDKGSMKKTAIGAHSVDRRLKGAARTSSNASKNFSKMAQGISGGLVPAYATLAASLFALDAVYRALSGAADLRILKEGQMAFAKSTGQAMNVVAGAVQRATQFQVSFKEASQAAAIAASAGFGTSQIVALGKAANDAAKVLGRSVPDAFDRLIRGVVKAEPEVLDELGIILRLDDAAEAYALRMGLTASELTVFEKQQAVLNDVLDQAERKFAAVAESIDPNPWTQLGVALEKVKDDFAIIISSVLEPIATFLAGNAYAAIAAMGIFIAGIMKSLLPSYAAQAAKFKETQTLQRGQIDLTIAKMNQLKLAKQGGTEALGMAEGRAMGVAQKAAPAGKRTTLGKLQRGRVISAKQASREIIRVRALEGKRIEGLTKKQTADYIRFLRTIETETKIGTKKIRFSFTRMGTFLQLNFQRLKMAWKTTMMAMTRLATLAGRAMSLAMSAMGWVSMIYMAVTAFQAWKKSTEEVDEAAEKLKKRVDDLNKTFEDLLDTFIGMNKEMDTIRDGWTTSKEAVAFYSNTVKNIPLQDTIDLLKELDGKAVPVELRKNMEKVFDEMKRIVPALEEMNAGMDSEKLLEYVEGFSRLSAALQSINIIYGTATEAEVKYKKAQKARMDALIKSDYKKEIRELVSLVSAYAALKKVEEELTPLMKEINREDDKSAPLLAERRKQLEALLDIRYEELVLQKDQLRIASKISNLYKYEKKEKARLVLETEELVNAMKREQQLLVAIEALKGFSKVAPHRVFKTGGQRIVAQKGREWDFAEAEVQIARLEYEDKLHQIRLDYLDEIATEWSRMAETIVESMASGMQKGFEDMFKGEKNLKEAVRAMAKTIQGAMAKQMSETWTETIMGWLPETKAAEAKRLAEEKADAAATLMVEKMEALRDVTQQSVDQAEETIKKPIELLTEALEELTPAIWENVLAMKPMSQKARESFIKANNPQAFTKDGDLMEGAFLDTAKGRLGPIGAYGIPVDKKGSRGRRFEGPMQEGTTLASRAMEVNEWIDEQEKIVENTNALYGMEKDKPLLIRDVDYTAPPKIEPDTSYSAEVQALIEKENTRRDNEAYNEAYEKEYPNSFLGIEKVVGGRRAPTGGDLWMDKKGDKWADKRFSTLKDTQIKSDTPFGTQALEAKLNALIPPTDKLRVLLEREIKVIEEWGARIGVDLNALTLEQIYENVGKGLTSTGQPRIEKDSTIETSLNDVTKGGVLQMTETEPGKFADAMSPLFSSILGQIGGSMGGIGGTIMGLFAAKGGYVTKRGIQGFAGGGKVRGSKDTVPAMLTPGEYVLTPGQMRSMGQGSTIVNVNMGEGGGTTTSVRSDRAEAAKFGRAIASAVNHEIMKQKRAGGRLWMPGIGDM